ncbi:MAG: MGH1-like glycoside hydrolase domain-containing protein [Kiritimatiellia bacterium]
MIALTLLAVAALPFSNGTVGEYQAPVAVRSGVSDFGKDAFGWLEVKGEGELTVRLGEKLRQDGKIEMKPGGTIRAAESTVTAKKGEWTRVPLKADKRNTRQKGSDGSAVLLPKDVGVVMPFRYVEVDGGKAEIRRVFVHWPIDMKKSERKFKDKRLQQVYDLCRYSILATSFTGKYIDGDRERIPYEGDAFINQLGEQALWNDPTMARNTMAYLVNHPTWPTEWKQHFIMMVYADWKMTKETSQIEKFYEAMKSKKLLMEFAREDGLLRTGGERGHHVKKGWGDLVDWPGCERDGYRFSAVNTVVNAFHYRNLLEMSEMAAAIGKKDDARDFAARAAKLKKSFNEQLFDAETGLYVDGEESDPKKRHSSLHANAAAVSCGLVDDKRKNAKIADFLVKKGLACSVYFAQHYLDALFLLGRGKDAVELMVSDGERSWMNMMREGATITMEAWGQKFKPNQDWNHAWGAVPLNIIHRHLLRR